MAWLRYVCPVRTYSVLESVLELPSRSMRRFSTSISDDHACRDPRHQVHSAFNVGMSLRDYQHRLLENTRTHYASSLNRQLWIASTGLGKTVAFASLPHMFPELMDRKHFRGGMLVLVHRNELVHQAAEKCRLQNPHLAVGIDCGSSTCDPDLVDIVVATVQSLGRENSPRLAKYHGRFGIVVVDEAHHIAPGSTYEKILDFVGVGPNSASSQTTLNPILQSIDSKLAHPKKLLVGVTATPNRTDKQGLERFFNVLSSNLDLRWGVSEGFLVDIRPYRISTMVDLDDAKCGIGYGPDSEKDFILSQLAATVDQDNRNHLIVEQTLRFLQSADFLDKRSRLDVQSGIHKPISAGTCPPSVLVFAASVPHAHHLASLFQDHTGDPAIAACIDANTDREERRLIVDKFRNKKLQVLCNFGVLTEGFDAPSVDVVVMARPTLSQPLYLQMLGRGTRPDGVSLTHLLTRERRLQAIEQSRKPHLNVLDFVDSTRKHRVVSCASLVGLPSTLDPSGYQLMGDLFPMAREIPSVFLHSESLDGPTVSTFADLVAVKRHVESVDMWKENLLVESDLDESIQNASNFSWMKLAFSVYGDAETYRLSLPASSTAGASGFRSRAPAQTSMLETIVSGVLAQRHIDVYKDPLGKWSVLDSAVSRFPYAVLSPTARRVLAIADASGEAEVATQLTSAILAIQAAESYVEGRYPHACKLLRREAPWKKDPCSPPQARYLLRYRLVPMPSSAQLSAKDVRAVPGSSSKSDSLFQTTESGELTGLHGGLKDFAKRRSSMDDGLLDYVCKTFSKGQAHALIQKHKLQAAAAQPTLAAAHTQDDKVEKQALSPSVFTEIPSDEWFANHACSVKQLAVLQRIGLIRKDATPELIDKNVANAVLGYFYKTIGSSRSTPPTPSDALTRGVSAWPASKQDSVQQKKSKEQ
eukprot:ANDGO_03938.mRNA.1 Putative ATP-dependent helicase IRC3